MNPFLIKQPGFNEKSKMEIYRNIRKEGFDSFIVHNPTFETNPLLNINRIDSSGFIAFAYGEQYNLAISKSLKIYCWPRGDDKANAQVIQMNSLSKKLTSEKEFNPFPNPLDLLSKLAGDRKATSQTLNIQKMIANKSGTFAIILADNYCFALLTEYNEIRLIERTAGVREISCATIIEENRDTANSPQRAFQFFLGTVKGQLKFGQIVIQDKSVKRVEGNVKEELRTVHEFKIMDTQLSIINGIALFSYNQRNHLFMAVDKRLMHFQNKTTFESFATKFSAYLPDVEVIMESNYFHNSLYGIESFANYAFSLYMVDKGNVNSITLNFLEQSRIKSSHPIFDSYGKIVPNFQTITVQFHPYLYHYALIYEKDLIIVSTLSNEVLFKKQFDSGIKNIAKHPSNNNLIINNGLELIEIKILNEMIGSWIHLVENNMEELAYLTCKNYDINYDSQAARILAYKLFNNKDYNEALIKLFEAREPFEKVIWKLYEARSNSEEFFTALVTYCKQILADLEEKQVNDKKSIKFPIIIIFLIECLSYKYVQVSRLLDIKESDPNSHPNITVTDSTLKFYEDALNELLSKYLADLNKGIVMDIFQSHGNFHFAHIFSNLNKTFYDIIYDCYYSNQYLTAIKTMKSYLAYLCRDCKDKKNLGDLSRPFNELIEKFGEEFCEKEPDEFQLLLKEIVSLSTLQIMSEEFITRCFFFATGKPIQESRIKIVKMIVN